MAACHDEGDRFMAAFQSALKKDGVPERAHADRLFTLAHRMLSATVEVDPSVLKDTSCRAALAQRAALEQLQRAFKTSADAGLARDAQILAASSPTPPTVSTRSRPTRRKPTTPTPRRRRRLRR